MQAPTPPQFRSFFRLTLAAQDSDTTPYVVKTAHMPNRPSTATAPHSPGTLHASRRCSRPCRRRARRPSGLPLADAIDIWDNKFLLFPCQPPASTPCIGSRTIKVLPRPMPALCAVTLPPCSSVRFLTSAKPIPSPPIALCSLRSPWTNGQKMRGNRSADSPIPVSVTSIISSLSINRVCKVMSAPHSL